MSNELTICLYDMLNHLNVKTEVGIFQCGLLIVLFSVGFFFPVLKCSKVASILLECSNALVSNDKMAYKGLKKQDKFTLSSTFNELFWVYHFIDGPFLQTEKFLRKGGTVNCSSLSIPNLMEFSSS